ETAAAVGVEEGRVRSVVLRPGDDGLLVDFELNHPASLAEAAVDARLRGCAYAALWALYEPRPRLEEEKVVTTHELGFEGEDWDYVLEQRGVEVREAAAIETARALGVEREDVVEVELDVVPQNLVVFVTVRHSSRLSEGEVDGLLAQCQYKTLWAQYDARPLELIGALNGMLISAEEVEAELDPATYLRGALLRARRERDEYMERLGPMH
ncbi:putative microtubule-associated protein Gb4, partial [Trypanosoma conorhini]